MKDLTSILNFYKGSVTLNDYYNMPCYVINSLRTSMYEHNIMTDLRNKIQAKGDNINLEIRSITYDMI